MGERVITATRLRDDQRLAVELDGEAWIALDPLDAARLGLDVGTILDDAGIADAEALAARDGALRRGARMVGRRSHARGELERKLARTSGDEAAREAADRLAAMGAVDDERHARDLAAQRLAAGWGPARIAHDLAAAGVADGVITATLAALDPADVLDAARRAAGDRAGAAGWQRLAARGFDEDVAERLLGLPDA